MKRKPTMQNGLYRHKRKKFTNTYTVTKQKDILMCYKNLWKVTMRVTIQE